MSHCALYLSHGCTDLTPSLQGLFLLSIVEEHSIILQRLPVSHSLTLLQLAKIQLVIVSSIFYLLVCHLTRFGDTIVYRFLIIAIVVIRLIGLEVGG